MTDNRQSAAPRAAFVEPKRPLVSVLSGRRRLREGLITLLYVTGAVILTIALGRVTSGPKVEASVVAPTLGAVAGGMLAFTGVVFSLLVLVVQFGSTAFTPRLNLFRDDPFVWHAFAFFVATIVYCFLAALNVSNEVDVSVLVPVMALLAALVALALFRGLQQRALLSIQLAPAVESVASRGWELLESFYQLPAGDATTAAHEGPVQGVQVRWRGPARVVQQIDLAGLLAWAESRDALVEINASIGSIVTVGDIVASVDAHVEDPDTVLTFMRVGLERTFDQDPLFAFRLLSDITLRALSPAVNDPATAIQVLSATHGLLGRVVGSKLDLSEVQSQDGQLRVLLRLPTWTDFLAEALDETASAARAQATVLERLERLLDDLESKAPQERRSALRIRRDWVAARLAAAGPLPGSESQTDRAP
jgi:uncharacterized membrane protein